MPKHPRRIALYDRLVAADDGNSAPETPASVLDFPARGRRLNAKQIAKEFYGGHVSAEWVTDKVQFKVPVGYRTILWWEYDVRYHLELERRKHLGADAPRPSRIP